MYVPHRGDVVWIDFDPQRGHEIQKMRPAVTLTPDFYNDKTGLGLFAPITSKIKNYPFVVRIQHDLIDGVILCDQIKSFDWRIRDIQYVLTLNSKQMEEVTEKIKALIF